MTGTAPACSPARPLCPAPTPIPLRVCLLDGSEFDFDADAIQMTPGDVRGWLAIRLVRTVRRRDIQVLEGAVIETDDRGLPFERRVSLAVHGILWIDDRASAGVAPAAEEA